MRHYEIVFLVHPDQSEQVPAMIDRYKEMVSTGGGNTHRSEDWGRRKLAYSISDVHKAHYAMINIECSLEVLREIERNFKFNDSILRHLVVRRNHAITDASSFAIAKAEEDRLEVEKLEAAAQAKAEEEAADDEAGDESKAESNDKSEETV